MKVTLTKEGIDTIKELRRSGRIVPLSPDNETKNTFHLTSLKNLESSSKIPSLKSATEVQVRKPRILISKDFEYKYPVSAFNTQSTSNLQSSSEPFPELINHQSYMKNRLSIALERTSKESKIREIEDKYKKILDIHNMQLKKRQIMINKIKQMREDAEASRTEKVERFRFDFDDMTSRFEEQLLADTRKKRKKEMISKLCLNRYANIWRKNKILTLSIPKRRVNKFVEICYQN